MRGSGNGGAWVFVVCLLSPPPSPNPRSFKSGSIPFCSRLLHYDTTQLTIFSNSPNYHHHRSRRPNLQIRHPTTRPKSHLETLPPFIPRHASPLLPPRPLRKRMVSSFCCTREANGSSGLEMGGQYSDCGAETED